MDTTTQQVQSRLERFEFEALFIQTLGWQFPKNRPSLALPRSKACQDALSLAQVRLLAIAPESSVIEIQLPGPWTLSPDLRQQVYQALAEQVPNPILIFVVQDRSLWVWARVDQAPLHSRVIIKAQPDLPWSRQLTKLHRSLLKNGRAGCILSPSQGENSTVLYEKFEASLTVLREGIKGLPRKADRQHYALVVLSRLIAVVALQRSGWLNRGDEWYLHNLFGQSQQQGPDHFFSGWFQFLCRAFTLPPQERSRAEQRLGEIPFIPNGPFHIHPLEQTYGSLQISDAVFEPALEWLGDLATTVPTSELPDVLNPVFEQFINSREDLPLVTPPPILEALCDRTVQASLLRQGKALLESVPTSWEDLLMLIPATSASQLLEQGVGMSVLDPACGSGRYLSAALKALVEAGSTLAAIVQTTDPTQLPTWLRQEAPMARALTIQRRILNGSFWGVDLSAQAVEVARLTLFLGLIAQVKQANELLTLPDICLNIVQGNALIGLVAVDSERFDQVQGGRVDTQPEPEPVALQGNLLQPLVAESYRFTLAERQIRLEHYRDQTHLLSEVNGIPGYVQAEFLRDRLLELDRTAQAKLNRLLLSEFSQQLGIRYRQTDSQGRVQRRLLTLEDIQLLCPFHWGFHVHDLLARREGFDLVLCHPPWGIVQATAEDFFTAFEDLFERKGILLEAFRHHRKQLFTIDADLATAWRDYCGQFTHLSDYLRKTETYRHVTQPPATQSQMRLYQARLFLERSLQLVRPGGLAALLLPVDLWHQSNAALLRSWLQETTQVLSLIELSNHQGALGKLAPNAAISLVWLQQGGVTPSLTQHEYQGREAPTREDLLDLLQSLVNLTKEQVETG